MGLMDKVKKILFDEDEVEIPVNSDELPERTPKKPAQKTIVEKKGFIDYHHDDEEIVEEDTIKEVIVPKDDEDTKPIETKSFNFPMDIDFEPEVPLRTRSHEVIEEPIRPVAIEPRRDYFKEEVVEKKVTEEKDYRKIISATEQTKEKKPFKVTPIISPVYGILDKNYKPEEVVNKSEEPVRKSVSKEPRLFGPVSYNDQPLPEPHKYEAKESTSLKEELVELNTTISELINDTVNPSEINANIPETVEEIETPKVAFEEEPEEIMTSGIENEYIGNNNIEDAFESTSEFDSINESDTEVEDITPTVDIDNLIKDEDDENLDDTIETNLFNLIDSMYKSDDTEDLSEEE